MAERSDFPFTQLLVETHERFSKDGDSLKKEMVAGLERAGFAVVHHGHDMLTFLRRSDIVDGRPDCGVAR